VDRSVALHAARRLVRQTIGLIFATIALNVAAVRLKSAPVGFVAELCGLIAITFGIVAVFRVGEALGYSMLVRVVLALVVVIPLANLIMFFVLHARATKVLAVSGG